MILNMDGIFVKDCMVVIGRMMLNIG